MGGGDVTVDDVMAAIIAALEPPKPPADARSSDDIAEAMGITKQRVYEFVTKARKAGKIEAVGKFGGVMYYRIKP
jgi:predicted transcriptional regulator